MIRSIKAYLYAGLATLCWSTVASAFKITLRYLDNDVFTMLFFSILFSVMVLFIAVRIQRDQVEMPTVSKRGVVSSMLLGFINPFLYYIILFKAYSLLPGQEALPLNYTWPIWLTILSVPLLHQKVRVIQLFGIFISFCGVLIISTRGKFWGLRIVHVPGVFLALGSAVVWALYWIFNLKDERKAEIKLLMNFCFGFIYIGIYLFLTKGIVFPRWEALAGTAWIGIFEMGLTFIFWLKALENTESTSTVSSIVYLSPFISLLFLKVSVGEQLLFSSVLGLFCIIFGIFIQTLRIRKFFKRDKKPSLRKS